MLRPAGMPGMPAAGVLMLDLQVVADRVDDHVPLDQAGDERCAAVGVAQVHSGAGPDDRVAADDPVPRRALGRDADRLLIVAVPADDEILQRDVVRRARLFLRLHGVDRKVVALQHEVADHQVARVDDADGAVSWARDKDGGRTALRPGDGDRSTGLAGQAVRRQSIAILAGGKRKRVARPQQRDQVTIVVGGTQIERVRTGVAHTEERSSDEDEQRPR